MNPLSTKRNFAKWLWKTRRIQTSSRFSYSNNFVLNFKIKNMIEMMNNGTAGELSPDMEEVEIKF